ncbi:cell division protein FtsB [Neisseriaceae bacterium ESL0693]|nr:cell division protein FtsB [Neisseriaceae bacterium ESL0693]
MKWVTWVLVVALTGLQYELWFGHSSYFNMWQLKKQLLAQSQKNEQLIHRNQALTAEVKDLAEGKEAITEIARVSLGYIQDGEIFYRFVAPSSESVPDKPRSPTS